MSVSVNEWSGLKLVCTPAELRPDGTCQNTEGEQLLHFLGFDLTVGACVGILLFFIVGCRSIAYLGIRLGS